MVQRVSWGVVWFDVLEPHVVRVLLRSPQEGCNRDGWYLLLWVLQLGQLTCGTTL